MEVDGNIIIFGDFAVFSSFPKEKTLYWLTQSYAFLSNYHGEFPIGIGERILIEIVDDNFKIISSMTCHDTTDFLERTIDLLASNDTDFFCPD